jgi:hypothetical protein
MARNILGLGDKPERKLPWPAPEFFPCPPLILIDYKKTSTGYDRTTERGEGPAY